MADQDTIFCERCGAVVPVGERFIAAHYCAACRLFLCMGCWSESGPRCANCETTPLTSWRVRDRISWARNLLQRLEAEPRKPATAPQPATVAGLEDNDLRLTAVRVESTAALGIALVAGSSSLEARRLRGNLEFERLRAIRAISKVRQPAGGAGHARMRRSLAASLAHLKTWQAPRSARPVILGVAGAFGALSVAVVAIAVLVGGRESIPAGAIGGNSTPTPEGAVAGNRMATPTPAPLAEPGSGGRSSTLTFDELIMGRPLPRAIARMVQGTAEVAAIPNAVDRSLRLVASEGTPGMICQALAGGGSEIVVAEVMSPAPNGQRLVLRRVHPGDAAQAGIAVGEGGGLILVPDGTAMGSVSPDEWLVVEMKLDASAGTLDVTTESAGDGASASARVHLSNRVESVGRTEFCISTAADAGAEIYVNNWHIY